MFFSIEILDFFFKYFFLLIIHLKQKTKRYIIFNERTFALNKNEENPKLKNKILDRKNK